MSDTVEKTKLHRVHALNDVVAVMKVIEVSGDIEVPAEELEKMSNEGVVVGIGPDAEGAVELGDIVIIRPIKYMAIVPGGGDYEDQTVVLARKMDLMVKKPNKSDKYEIE